MSNLPYISPELVTNYKTQIETSASPATAKRKVASLKKFFNWAHEAGHIENNPMPKTTPEKIVPNELKTIIRAPVSKKPAKYLNVTNLVRILFGVGIMFTTFAILSLLKVPIPFISSPASENRNLVTINDSVETEVAPSLLPSIVPSLIPSPTPTQIPSNVAIVPTTPLTQETEEDEVELTNPPFGGLIEAEVLTLSTTDLSDGDISVNPDGSGNLNLIFEGNAGNNVNATNANLNSGSLYYGYVGNNSTSYNLLLLQSGSNQTTRFSVDALGNTRIVGNLSEVHDVNLMGNLLVNGKILLTQSGKLNFITGYYQESGLFDINQGAHDYGLIHKTLTDQTGKATREVLKIELDESQLADGSSEDSLIVSRKNAKSDGYAIYVSEGNVKFEGDLGVSQNLTVNNLAVNNNLTLSGNSNITGQGVFTFSPSQAHTGTWAIGSSTWNADDASIYVNPASATADSNLFALAVGGSVVFDVDAEGDIYARNLILTGSTSVGTTTVAGDLTVEGNTTLGDAGTDTLTFTASVAQDSDLIPLTTTGTNDLGSSSLPWDNLYIATSVTTSDDSFVGLGSGAALIEFDDQTTDEVNILNANVGIGTTEPVKKLQVGGRSGFDAGSGVLFDNGGAGQREVLALSSVRSSGVGANDDEAQLRFLSSVSNDGTGTPYLVGAIGGLAENAQDTIRDGAIVFRPADNEALTERMRITSAGNVGIANTSPTYKLQVSEASTGIGGFRICNGGYGCITSSQQGIGGGGSLTIGSFDSITLDARAETWPIYVRGQIQSNNSTNLRIQPQTNFNLLLAPDSGNVGIRDTSPDYSLEIYDATNTPAFALSDDDIAHGVTTLAETDVFFHLSSISTTDGGAVLTGLSDAAAGTGLLLKGIQSSDPTDTVPAISLIASKASGTGVVDLGNDETVFQIANNDNTAALTILGSGEVGIGTVTPSVSLEVNGDIKVSNGSTVNPSISAGNSNTGFYDTGGGEAGLIGGSSGTVYLRVNGAGGSTNGTFFSAQYQTSSYGTAAAPVFTFQSIDTDTGMFRPSSNDNLGFSTGGTEKLRIDPEGDVGIGSTAPDARLEINHATGDNLRLTYNDSDGSATAYTDFTLASDGDLTIDSAGGAINLSDDLFLSGDIDMADDNWIGLGSGAALIEFDDQTTDEVNILNANVGIGTSTPLELLNLSSSGDTTLRIDTTSPTGETGFDLYNNTPTLIGSYHIDVNSNITTVFGYSGFQFTTNSNAQALKITNTGLVGIGDTGPDYLLELHDATNTPAFALSDDDIAHGVTTLAQTDVFYHLSSLSTTDGGTLLTAFADNVNTAGALEVRGVLGNTPDDTVPAIKFSGSKGSGTGVADLDTTETVFQIANNDNAASFTVEGDGDVVIVGSATTCTIGNGTGATNCSSDERLKENIANLDIGLDEILALRPVNYNWKDKTKPQTKNVGLIAQEVITVIPQAVGEVRDGYLGIDYASLVVPLIKSVQELNAKTSEASKFIAENVVDGALAVDKFTTKTLMAESGEFVNFASEYIQVGSLIAREATVNGTLKVANIFTNSIIANVVKAGELVTENIVAGIVQAEEVAVEGMLTTTDFIATNIQAGAVATKEFTTDSAIAFTASIDNLLVTSGLISPNIKTAKIESINESEEIAIAGDIKVEGQTTTKTLAVENDATVAGTFYADKIVANTLPENPKITEIEKLLKEVEGNQKFLYEIAEKTNLSVESVEGGLLSNLSVAELYVTGQTAVNNLSVSRSISFSDLVIQSSSNESPVSSVDSLIAPLSLQSLALAPIELMAGRIKIDTSGNAEFLGNVNIAGNLNVEGQSRFGTLITDKLIIASQGVAAKTSPEDKALGLKTVVETNASAGEGTISTGESEIIINNPSVSDNTLVYITPTSGTNNQVLFVKSKEVGSFTVGFINPTDTEVSFNWWIIDVQQ